MELKSYFAQNSNGVVIPRAKASLFLKGTQTLAVGLQDKDGNELPNPFTASDAGLIQFAAPNGMYDLQVENGSKSFIIPVQCVDFDEYFTAINNMVATAQSSLVDTLAKSNEIKSEFQSSLDTIKTEFSTLFDQLEDTREVVTQLAVSSIAELPDVANVAPKDKEALMYDAATGQWTPSPVALQFFRGNYNQPFAGVRLNYIQFDPKPASNDGRLKFVLENLVEGPVTVSGFKTNKNVTCTLEVYLGDRLAGEFDLYTNKEIGHYNYTVQAVEGDSKKLTLIFNGGEGKVDVRSISFNHSVRQYRLGDVVIQDSIPYVCINEYDVTSPTESIYANWQPLNGAREPKMYSGTHTLNRNMIASTLMAGFNEPGIMYTQKYIIPTDTSWWPLGHTVKAIQSGISPLSFEAEENVSMKFPQGCLAKARGVDSIVEITKIADMTFILSGDLLPQA